MAGWLKKKWLNLGPGSPGKTAKVMAENYQSIVKNNDITGDDVYTILVGRRVMTWAAGNIMPQGFTEESMQELVELSDKDLPTLTYFLMYIESPIFRRSVRGHPNNIKDVTEVIYEEISKKAPNSINKSLSEFQNNALSFSKSHG